MDRFGEGDSDYGGYGRQGGNGSTLHNPGFPTKSSGNKLPRPIVDPDESGEVDPEKYGPAKEATHKIRGKSDLFEFLCGSVDQELLMVKTFYLFFYSAFGSLFPLMGVYFKQMGMNAGHCGLLIGARPFIEFLSAPFWGSYADRWQKGKTLLLTSLACWIIFTLPIGFIQPPATSCMERKNNEYTLRVPEEPRPGLIKREIHLDSYRFDFDVNPEEEVHHSREKRSIKPLGNRSPVAVGLLISNYDEKVHKDLVLPSFSSIVYRTQDIQKAFFLLLLLVIIGEFFSAPAITLADSAVITILGEDADRYGHQRMFGSLGWGLAMFFVGIALDHSTSFPDHPCGPTPMEKNYTICFATFSVLMGAALITATQINFKYDDLPESAVEKAPIQRSHEDTLQNELAQQLGLPILTNPSTGVDHTDNPQPAPDIGQSTMFAQTTRKMPEWVTVLKQFRNLKCASFLFVAWFMGFGIGLIFTFLFWHLQDYGGSPTLFGVASVINHISEIFAYFFSFRLITQMGHVKVLCLGLLGNIIRFLYISWLSNPWWVLPFEFIQGITHAAVWAACCSYIAHNTPQQLRSSAQGVLQGIHHGLGRGCGAVIGGILVNYCGSTNTFRGYGFACAVVLGGFVFINFYHKDVGFVANLPPTVDPRHVAETSHLAPHGVPSNPIPRALSSTRINELANQDQSNYGSTYRAADGSLGIPGQTGGGGGVNPFRHAGHESGKTWRLANLVEKESDEEKIAPGKEYAYRLNGNGNVCGIRKEMETFENHRPKFNSEEEQIRRHFQLYSEILSTAEKNKFKSISAAPVESM